MGALQACTAAPAAPEDPSSAGTREMSYPTSWDPFFSSHMTLADLYRYPTRHDSNHRRQLTLSSFQL